MSSFVLSLQDVDKTRIALVGGKGANLGELSRIEGICVPEGFCITTAAFGRIMAEAPAMSELLARLSLLELRERDRIGALSAEIRRVIEGIPMPDDLGGEIVRLLTGLGAGDAYAVRSSATAEDLPTASFAGQQDSYLNLIGRDAILSHISKCWASLFSERAVTYRLQNGFDHRKVQMSVLVQKMVFPQVAGILFTADPVTGHRKLSSIEAGFGLGEALVSGLVSADSYQVRDGAIVDKVIAAKKLEVCALPDGGTAEQAIEPARQNRQALTDEQILRLARIGRQIEAHFGQPQDIEWCLRGETFHLVQSRPITTLFPIPEANDQDNHVYLSVGHQQMMTDAMKPLGLSFFLLTTPAPMRKAGGRLFVDVTRMLAAPGNRHTLIESLGKSDPLLKDALTTVVEREGFIRSATEEIRLPDHIKSDKDLPTTGFQARIEYDPAIVPALIARSQASLDALKQTIQTKSGAELFDFMLEDIQQLRKLLTDPQSSAVFLTAMDAAEWINERMNAWLGEKNVADTLTQSVQNNITSEMGLALLDVADAIRPYPEVIAYLQHVDDDAFLQALPGVAGGQAARDAIRAFLDSYGMRCVGEIDVSRPRWCEKPTALVPVILSNLRNFEPGASRRKFEQGRQKALKKEQEILARLRQLPDGDQKATETKRVIDLLRSFIAYREYPKYGMVSRYFVYKQALLKEAGQLVRAGVIPEKEDIFYLSFEELREAVCTQRLDAQLISQRKAEQSLFEKLTPPRVLTSEGEIITGRYKREKLPADALAGLAVSAGMAEGRARVILKLEDADLDAGDILVTAYTDPSWTPLFVAIKGLVTEVGGLMTHGAVIAREYGLPAVVGVEHATRLIQDGQRIRVHGTEGYVEILS